MVKNSPVEWLEVENAQLKEESEAVAAAAQAIGQSLRGRVRELETQKHSKISNTARFVTSDQHIRDGFFFLAGILTGLTVYSILGALRTRH